MGEPPLNERLIGKQVFVEKSLSSGPADYHTILYSGTYAGLDLLGTVEVIVLEDARYFSRAGVLFSNSKDPDSQKTGELTGGICYIPQAQVLSIYARNPKP